MASSAAEDSGGQRNRTELSIPVHLAELTDSRSVAFCYLSATPKDVSIYSMALQASRRINR